MGRGLLFVVSAPSGTGKTTLVDRLAAQVLNLVRSCSYTSRPIRAGERDGVDYNFISADEFRALVERGEFLEWADVFNNLYGTRGVDTERLLSAGRDVVLVIDVQGARQIRDRGVGAVSVFVLPPSFRVLEQRLRGRSKDSEAQIRRRLEVAREEVTAYRDYDYLVVNDDVDACVDRLRGIVVAERARLRVVSAQAEAIAGTFQQA